MAIFDDKVLISGSVDGRVNLCDLDSEERKVYKCQNCQDRKIPIGKIVTSDYGIGAVIDIEGNTRFYDLIRLRKMCKISAKTKSVKGQPTWRMFPEPVVCTNSEALLGVIQGTTKIEIMRETIEATASNATPEMNPPVESMSESDLLQPGKFSDVKENLRSLN